MVDSSLLIAAIGGTDSIQLEPGTSDVEIISGVASISQDRFGVVTEAPLNITFPITGAIDVAKRRSCLFVDPITGDLVGYTSEESTGWTTCPKGYVEPCTKIVEEASETLKCQVQSTGEFVVVQYSGPVYPSPPPPPPTFVFAFPPPPPVDEGSNNTMQPPPPPLEVEAFAPPPPSVIGILKGKEGSNMALIVGGAAGGVVICAVILSIANYLRRTRVAREEMKEAQKVDISRTDRGYGSTTPVQDFRTGPPVQTSVYPNTLPMYPPMN